VVAVLTIVLALDEVFIGFAGQPVAVVRRELAAACVDYDCPLDDDTLTAFAREISAGHRVEINAGVGRVVPNECDGAIWDGGAPF
jgi:hypothetical protein